MFPWKENASWHFPSCTKVFTFLNVTQLFITVIFSQGLSRAPSALAVCVAIVPCFASPSEIQSRAVEGQGWRGSTHSTQNLSELAPPGLVDAYQPWPLQLLRRCWGARDWLEKVLQRRGGGGNGMPWNRESSEKKKKKTSSHPNIILSQTVLNNGRGSALSDTCRRWGVACHSHRQEHCQLQCSSTPKRGGRSLCHGESSSSFCRLHWKQEIAEVVEHTKHPTEWCSFSNTRADPELLQPASHASPWKQTLLSLSIWANLVSACGWPSSELPGVILWSCESAGTTAPRQRNLHPSKTCILALGLEWKNIIPMETLINIKKKKGHKGERN